MALQQPFSHIDHKSLIFLSGMLIPKNKGYFQNHSTKRKLKFQVDGNELELTLWDTAGQEAYEVIRPLAYKDAGKIQIKLDLSGLNRTYSCIFGCFK